MLNRLSSALKKGFDKIAGAMFIDKKTIEIVVKDLQRALIQADVNVQLVKELGDKIKKQAENEKIKGIEKKEHLTKILHDEILNLLGREKYEIKLDKKTAEFLKTVWPGPVSVILSCKDKKFNYLHRGKETLAFRLPKNKFLQNLIKQTGHLVAPSANPEGLAPATTITEAKKYFNNEVDFYLSAGQRLSGQPSTLIKLTDGKIEVLRQGRGCFRHTHLAV